MAKTLTQIGIETGNTVEAYHVTQSIDAFTATEAYDISLSGSFNMTGSINGEPGVINPLTASYAITASYVLNAGTSIDTGSFVTTSSFNSFTSSFNSGSFSGSFSGSLNGTSSWAENSLTASFITASNVYGPYNANSVISASHAVTASYAANAGSSTLTTGILTNVTVGALTSGTNLPIGTSLESIFQQMLVTYIPPTLSSLVMKNGGSTISTAARDVNDSFTVNTASFSATSDNPTGIFPLSSSWTSSGADAGTQTYYFGNNVLSTSNNLSIGANYTINRASTAGSVTFTVNGKRSDNNTNISSTTTSVPFRFRNYFAASSTVITDNSTAQTVINSGLVTSALDTDKAWNVTCTSANDTLGNFTYIIYPSSYGALSGIIQNGALPVLTAFTDLGTFSITTAYGVSLSVKVYKSNSDQAFANGTTLAIT